MIQITPTLQIYNTNIHSSLSKLQQPISFNSTISATQISLGMMALYPTKLPTIDDAHLGSLFMTHIASIPAALRQQML
jgi:hypothetical protein